MTVGSMSRKRHLPLSARAARDVTRPGSSRTRAAAAWASGRPATWPASLSNVWPDDEHAIEPFERPQRAASSGHGSTSACPTSFASFSRRRLGPACSGRSRLRVEVVLDRRIAAAFPGGERHVAALAEQVARVRRGARHAVAVQHVDRRRPAARAFVFGFRPSAAAFAFSGASTSGVTNSARRCDVRVGRRDPAVVVRALAGHPRSSSGRGVRRVVREERVARTVFLELLLSDWPTSTLSRDRATILRQRRSAELLAISCLNASRTAAGARAGRGRSRCAGSGRSRARAAPLSLW